MRKVKTILVAKTSRGDLNHLERPRFGPSKRKPLPPKHSISELIDISNELAIIKQENLHGIVNILTTPVEVHEFRSTVLDLVNCDRNINGSTEWNAWLLHNELLPKLKTSYPLFYEAMKYFVIS